MAEPPLAVDEPLYSSVPTITRSLKGVIFWVVVLLVLVVLVWTGGTPEIAIVSTLIVGVIFYFIIAAFNEKTDIYPDRIVLNRLVNGVTIPINKATRVTVRGTTRVMIEGWSGVYRLGWTDAITPEMIEYIRSRAAASTITRIWKKFPADIVAVLSSSKWSEDRCVDIDDYLEQLTEAGYPEFPALTDFLENFGGLKINYGSKTTYEEINIDPTVALINVTRDMASNYILRAGEVMVPVGTFSADSSTSSLFEPDFVLFMGTSGSLYCTLDDELYRLGENIIEGLTRIIRKIEWQEIDASGGLVPMSDEEDDDDDVIDDDVS